MLGAFKDQAPDQVMIDTFVSYSKAYQVAVQEVLDGKVEQQIDITPQKYPDIMISKGQAIAEVNSEKLTNNAESEFDGVLLKIIVAEDESAACGETIAIIGPAGTDVSGLTGQAASATAPEAAPVETTSAPAAKPAADVVITPRAKKYAEEKGLAYAHIVGTGIGGAITIDDVKKNGKPAAEVKIEKPAPAPAAPAKPAAAPTPAKPAPSQIKAPVLPGDNVMPSISLRPRRGP